MEAGTSPIKEIKRRLDIVEVVGRYVALKKSGRNFKGLCPFHSEKTPSFYVFPEGQHWHCFGACNAGGDLFGFVMRAENLAFGEALRLLAGRAGVELHPPTPAQSEAEAQRKRLFEVNRAAAEYFQAQLRAEAGREAREYLARRGLKETIIQEFQLGYAPQSWDGLIRNLTARGYPLEELQRAGLAVEREGGGHYDRFRERIIFPIPDPEGRVVGFGGRVLGEDLPKYLNSPQTPLFDKGSTLYGLYQAGRAIREAGLAVIVEGYMDVLTAHQAGFRNLVASLGTALTEAHLRALKRYAKAFTLALDADAAGSEATRRGLEVARGALADRLVPVPTPAGLIRYEGRLEVELRVLVLPPGKDPDDLIRESPALWEELLEEALSLVEWHFREAGKGLDLATARGKRDLAQRLLPIVAQIENGVERAHYLGRLAQMVQVDERTLWASWPRRDSSRRSDAGQKSKNGLESNLEEVRARDSVGEFCMALLVKEPKLVAGARQVELEEGDFVRTEDRELFRLLSDFVGERLAPSGEEFLALLKGEWLQKRLEELHAGSYLPLTEEEAKESFLRLREQNQRRKLTELRFLAQEATASGEKAEMARLWEAIAQETARLKSIQRRLFERSLAARRTEKTLRSS